MVATGRNPIARRLRTLAEAFVAAGRGSDLNPASNGEYRLLRQVAPLGLRTIFDVGANHGEWATEAAHAMPDAAIHAFEIVPTTARHLAEVAAALPAIRANAFGLAEAPGVLRVHVSGLSDKLSSLLPVQSMAVPFLNTQPWVAQDVEVMRGDAYCGTHAITGIDILKIDVEGAENRVIDGFGSFINDGRVGLIQFEYGLANIHSRYLLADYYTYLVARGYRIGKLLTSGVAFKDYAMTDEDFLGPNYVAVHASRPDMFAAVAQ